MLVLTQSEMFLIGPISQFFGIIMDYIYRFLGMFGIESIGWCIILFTLITNLLMLPLTIRQQKFSKLSAVMNPEIQAVQKKYKDKKDNESMMKMNQEMKVIYEKYGTSPTGGCLQMLIQLPIIFALYRVIMNIPAYVPSIKNIFNYEKLVEMIRGDEQYHEKFLELAAGKITNASEIFSGATDKIIDNKIIDVLYKFSNNDWTSIKGWSDTFHDIATKTQDALAPLNNFFGLNLAESPWNIIKGAVSGDDKDILLCIAALLIPILAGLTQFLNTKLMPQQASMNDDNNTMASSLKTMNTIMPIMSVVFCFTFAAGIGLYWIMGSVVRSAQQLFINRHMNRVDMDKLIEKNLEKVNKKREKKGLPPQKVTSAANMNVKSLDYDKKIEEKKKENKEQIKDSTEYYSEKSQAKSGSLSAKANMVKAYNEKANKK